jgi:hypothetical protein
MRFNKKYVSYTVYVYIYYHYNREEYVATHIFTLLGITRWKKYNIVNGKFYNFLCSVAPYSLLATSIIEIENNYCSVAQ